MGDGLRDWPLMMALALGGLLMARVLARPAARMWVLVFIAALAVWLGLWTLPAMWPGPRWSAEGWNWGGALLALGGTVWLAAMLVRRGALTWRELGFTRSQRAGSRVPALGVAVLALAVQAALTITGNYGQLPTSTETWIYQATLPGCVEETIFRGVLLALLDKAFPTRHLVAGAPIGWGGVVVTLAFMLLHPLTPSAQWAVWPPALLFLWLRARTGSLVLPVLVHNGWNTLAFLVGR